MTSQYPPGWYPDAQGVTRWWDGTQWTDHTQPSQGAQPPQGVQPPQAAAPAGQSGPLLWAAMASALIAVIGSIGPWGKLGSLSTKGTDGSDGFIVIVCVAIAAALLWLGSLQGRRWPFITACVLAVISTFVGVIDYSDVKDRAFDVGWGIVLVLLGSIALSILSLILMARRRAR